MGETREKEGQFSTANSWRLRESARKRIGVSHQILTGLEEGGPTGGKLNFRHSAKAVNSNRQVGDFNPRGREDGSDLAFR